MKKFLGVLLIFCSVFSFNKVYAMITEYEAKSFTITVQNIDEKIEKIDVVAFEECEMEETGFNYETTYEVVEPYGDGMIGHLQKHDTENYFIDQTVRYNYLSGRFKDDIEHAINGGSFSEVNENGIIDYDYAYDHIFKTKEDFEIGCSMVLHQGVVCAKTTKYTAYKLTTVKELDISNMESNEFVYNHDDLSNLKIGLRIKNEKGEYKTFIAPREIYTTMYRTGYHPEIQEQEYHKIVVFDYSGVTYQSNTTASFRNYLEPYVIIYGSIIIIVSILLLIIIIIALYLKKKKAKK